MILVIPKMDLGIGELGFTSPPRDKYSSERSRALGPSFGQERSHLLSLSFTRKLMTGIVQVEHRK